MMNSYDERLAMRKARLIKRSEKARNESNSSLKYSDDVIEGIPFGQPILVGHHSEAKHRNALKKSQNALTKGIELAKKADYLESKAASVGTGGINSDDPEAISKLKNKLLNLKQQHGKMKLANKAVRKKDEQALIMLGFSAETIAELTTPAFGSVGFPAYTLSGHIAEMKRVETRIAELEQKKVMQTTIEELDRFKLEINIEDNRVRIFFNSKPLKEVCQFMRGRGFLYSKLHGAWQCKATQSGINRARWAVEQLKVMALY